MFNNNPLHFLNECFCFFELENLSQNQKLLQSGLFLSKLMSRKRLCLSLSVNDVKQYYRTQMDLNKLQWYSVIQEISDTLSEQNIGIFTLPFGRHYSSLNRWLSTTLEEKNMLDAHDYVFVLISFVSVDINQKLFYTRQLRYLRSRITGKCCLFYPTETSYMYQNVNPVISETFRTRFLNKAQFAENLNKICAECFDRQKRNHFLSVEIN